MLFRLVVCHLIRTFAQTSPAPSERGIAEYRKLSLAAHAGEDTHAPRDSPCPLRMGIAEYRKLSLTAHAGEDTHAPGRAPFTLSLLH